MAQAMDSYRAFNERGRIMRSASQGVFLATLMTVGLTGFGAGGASAAVVSDVVAESAALSPAVNAWDLPDEDQSVVGKTSIYSARYEDTLLDIARRAGMGLEEIKLANPGVDLWIPGEGTPVQLPLHFVLPNAPRRGLVINVPEMRIYHYSKDGKSVRTFPISIGRVGWETPLGKTTVVRKKANPNWYPPKSIREEHAAQGRVLPKVVRAGPDNPLGSHAIYLGLPAYLIHGTNRPFSIGMRVSHGCIRLYPEDISELYALAKPEMPVNLVHQRVKMGWRGDRLYMEVHPVAKIDEAEAKPDLSEAVEALHRLLPEGMAYLEVDWDLVKRTLILANGAPVSIGVRPSKPKPEDVLAKNSDR